MTIQESTKLFNLLEEYIGEIIDVQETCNHVALNRRRTALLQFVETLDNGREERIKQLETIVDILQSQIRLLISFSPEAQ